MKTYFLQQEPIKAPFEVNTGRVFIDDRMHDAHEQLGSVQAASWKEAKEALLAAPAEIEA